MSKRPSMSKIVEQNAEPAHVTVFRIGRHGDFVVAQPMEGTFAWTPANDHETALNFAKRVSEWIELPILDKTEGAAA